MQQNRKKVEEAGLVDSKDLNMIDEDLSNEVTAAVEKAKNSPLPNVEELTTNVYEKVSKCVKLDNIVSKYDTTFDFGVRFDILGFGYLG